MIRLLLLALAMNVSADAHAETHRPCDPTTNVGEVCPDVLVPAEGEPLSERLEETDGVIEPPTEPFPMREAVPPDPDPETTPVIPPGELPGTRPRGGG